MVITKLWKSVMSRKAPAAPTVLSMARTTHTGLPRAHLPSLLYPETPRNQRHPHLLPYRGPILPRICQSSPGQAAHGVSHTGHFSQAKATCDFASATAGVFANYLVIWTLAHKVVNLLASPAENVSFKTVSLSFQATALISRTEDNWRKTDASFIPVEKAVLFCKKK